MVSYYFAVLNYLQFALSYYVWLAIKRQLLPLVCAFPSFSLQLCEILEDSSPTRCLISCLKSEIFIVLICFFFSFVAPEMQHNRRYNYANDTKTFPLKNKMLYVFAYRWLWLFTIARWLTLMKQRLDAPTVRPHQATSVTFSVFRMAKAFMP